MTRFFVVLLLALINIKLTGAKPIPLRLDDPFYSSQSISCEDLILQRISQLKDWEYQGYIALKSHQLVLKPHFYIWLTDQKVWLTISNNDTPAQFMPWQILTVSKNEVIWQVELPIYCDQQLTFTMQFKGK